MKIFGRELCIMTGAVIFRFGGVVADFGCGLTLSSPAEK